MAEKSHFQPSDDRAVGPGSTVKTSIQITGDDGSVFPAIVYDSVNVTDDPELRQPLIDGTLNEVQAPGDDGRIYRPAVPVIYHDEEARVFALLIPEARRHEEFECRRALLAELAAYDGVLPPYMRQFEVVFDATQIENLQGSASGATTAGPEEATQISERPVGPPLGDDERAEFEKQLQEKDRQLEELQSRLEETEQEIERLGSESTDDPGDSPQLEKRIAELDERAEELAQKEEKLEVDRQQLEQVASRIERDSARVDEARERLETEQAEVEQLRQELKDKQRKFQVKELNLEQEKIRLQQENEPAFASNQKRHANEATQVVTADQFIEISDAEEVDSKDETAAFSDPEVAGSDAVAAARSRRPEPAAKTIVSYESDELIEDFTEAAPFSDAAWFVQNSDDLVCVGYRVDDERALAFLDNDPAFLFQVHEVDEIPIISLTLAAFNDEGDCIDALAAPITDGDDRQRSILDTFARDLHLHLLVFDSDGQRVASWEAGAPIRRNIGWARQRLANWREEASNPEQATEVARQIGAEDFELVGSMNHPFDAQSFVEFEGASDVLLAVGIVGYWSKPEQFKYLIGNRAFPLETFRRIQKRVVRQALHWGIATSPELRQLAIDEAIILDKVSLTQRLISNFAEVCVGLRPNDLDPIEQWENWEALIGLAEELGITPDPEVLELAEVSLKRAEEYEEVLEQEEVPEDDSLSPPAAEPEALTQSLRAKKSGVTFYLPTERDGSDHFDSLMDAEPDTIGQALAKPDRRVEASQALIELRGADAIEDVFAVLEDMSPAQLAAVTRFVEERADGLEAGLMQSLETAGPAATFVAARALAKIGSTAAMPRLLDAVRDPARRGEGPSLAQCLAIFGDKLIPPLSRALKDDPEDIDLLRVLAELEKTTSGTLDKLADERSTRLQRAARRARELV